MTSEGEVDESSTPREGIDTDTTHRSARHHIHTAAADTDTGTASTKEEVQSKHTGVSYRRRSPLRVRP